MESILEAHMEPTPESTLESTLESLRESPLESSCSQSTQLPPLIEFNDAVVRRQGNVILDVEHFQLEQGESIAILGPNGAGKSTFIQLMTREILPLHRDNPPVYFKGDDRATLADIKSVILRQFQCYLY